MNGCLIYQVDEDYEVTQQWYEALRQSYFKIDYFDLNETIILPHEVTSLSELQLNFTSYLLVGTLKCTSIIYQRRYVAEIIILCNFNNISSGNLGQPVKSLSTHLISLSST